MTTKPKNESPLETPEDLEEFMSEDVSEELPEDLIEGKKEFPPEDEEDIDLPPIKEREKEHEDMLDIAADVPVQVVAVMGKKSVTLKDMASMKIGEVIELGRPANETVDLIAGGKLIAKGELVEIEGKLGVRIVKMVR